MSVSIDSNLERKRYKRSEAAVFSAVASLALMIASYWLGTEAGVSLFKLSLMEVVSMVPAFFAIARDSYLTKRGQ